jgi:hypothetical protein
MVRDENRPPSRTLKRRRNHLFSQFRNSLIEEDFGDRTAFEQDLEIRRPIGPLGLTELASRYRVAPAGFGEAWEFSCYS